MTDTPDTPTDERVATLPKWAQAWIEHLQTELFLATTTAPETPTVYEAAIDPWEDATPGEGAVLDWLAESAREFGAVEVPGGGWLQHMRGGVEWVEIRSDDPTELLVDAMGGGTVELLGPNMAKLRAFLDDIEQHPAHGKIAALQSEVQWLRGVVSDLTREQA